MHALRPIQSARRLARPFVTPFLSAAPSRPLSNSFGKSLRQEYGQDYTDDFLPEREAKEIELLMEQEARISLSRRPDDMLRHKTDYGGILYKYDLPTENLPIVFRS